MYVVVMKLLGASISSCWFPFLVWRSSGQASLLWRRRCLTTFMLHVAQAFG